MIRFVLADLRRLWAASLVVALLIALSVALGVTVTLQERALRLGSARAADKFDLVVGAPGAETQLVLSSVFLQPGAMPLVSGAVLAEVAADPRVAWAAPIGLGDAWATHPIVGTTTALVSGTTTGFLVGRVFALEGEAVVGSAVDLKPGAEIHPMHGDGASGEGGHVHAETTYRVVGKLKPTGTAWDRAILVPIQAVWHIHGLGRDHEGDDDHDEETAGEHHHEGGVDADAPLNEVFDRETPGVPAILVKPRSVGDAYRLRQKYRTTGTTQAVFPGEVLARLYSTLGDARTILTLVAAGAQALVAAALILITVIHVAQRRRQIGALRAFGAPRLAVFGIVWTEITALTAVGVAVGFAIGWVVSRVIADTLTGFGGVELPVVFEARDAWSALTLILVAAALAVVPAALAYRQSPVEALRG